MSKILMPALSPTMESGTLSKWLVKEGDEIEIGDIIAEIETDKAVMELESIYEGRIHKLLVKEGAEGIKVNEAIVDIMTEEPEPKINETYEPIVRETGTTKQNTQNTQFQAEEDSNNSEKVIPLKNNGGNERIYASPLAKRLAKQKNIDLSRIFGTGPHGRIVKRDIESFSLIESETTPKKVAKATSNNLSEVPLSQMRKTIAKRMSEAKSNIPHFYLRKKVNVESLIRSRAELNEKISPSSKISINDFIIKSCAKALDDLPNCKVIYQNEKMFRIENSDISIAVAIEDGLITPVLRKVEEKSLREIALETKELIKKAKEKKLKPEEYTGGCFSVSNLGMMEIDNFDAIINPPQTSILAVGKISKEPTVEEGTDRIFASSIMALNLSIDHRAIDGALGAEFLNKICYYLENPIRLLY